jgi:spore cortex biosynthesis protein YabQ
MSVWFQVYILAAMLVWGGILGIIFDIYRFIVPTTKFKGITQYILDSLFWLVIIIITFIVLILTNYGEVRFYLILGMTLGLVLYYLTLSRLVIKLLVFIKKVLLKILKVINGILKPFKKLLNKITLIKRK